MAIVRRVVATRGGSGRSRSFKNEKKSLGRGGCQKEKKSKTRGLLKRMEVFPQNG